MAYSCRIASTAAHQLLLLAFLFFVLQRSHLHCEARPTDLNNVKNGSNDATNPSEIQVIHDARKVTNLRAFLQSIVNLLDFPISVAAPAADDESHREREFDEIELDAPEKFIDTSAARLIYNAENQEEQENVEADHEPHLMMPFQKPGNSGSCTPTGNYIDDCWRCDSDWQGHRQALASCAVGFGQNAIGGQNGKLYVVTTNADDARNPGPGTLRYGVTRTEPLWIIFAQNMTIEIQGELIVSSFKTIDGRGADVHLVGTSQVTIENVTNVIVHGIHVHDIIPSNKHKYILTAPSLQKFRGGTDGDAIHIHGSTNVWVDHCYLANATDGLVDVTKNSTNVTVSNNYFENHDKVMLFGASSKDVYDRNMQITVAFNKFGPGLTQRMPRCRYGNCHVANNFYTSGWGSYAIGGSEDPTFLSQCNRYVAPDAKKKKQITTRIDDGGPTFGGWQKWNWISTGDSFANDAYFTGSGVQNASASNYDRARSFVPRPALWVPAMTEDAGPLNCGLNTC